MAQILISGSSSGLGKFLHQEFSCDIFSRNNTDNKIYSDYYDTIIHCAFNTSHSAKYSNYNKIIADNLLLTQKLLNLNYKQFIFISSIDIYPKNNSEQIDEETDFDIADLDNLYGHNKLLCEYLVQSQAKKFLILRPSALLGKYMRKNNLIKLLLEQKATLSLSKNSTFNFITYDHIKEIIQLALQNQISSNIYNLTSKENISLIEIAQYFEKEICFGNYLYQTGNFKNDRVAALIPNLNKTSLEIVIDFYQTFLSKNAELFCKP